MKNSVCLVLALFFISGCVSMPKFDPNASVKIEDASLGKRFLQNGKDVDLVDMLNKLEQNPATKESASSAKTWFYAGMGAAGAGGFLIGYNLVSTEDDRGSGLALGVAATALGLYFANVASDHIEQSLQIHNKKFGKGAAQFHILPYLSVAQYQSQATPVLGVQFQF